MNIEELKHGHLLTPHAKRLRSRCIVLAPGQEIGAHNTGEKEELIIILEGKAEVHMGSEVQEVGAKHSIFIPTFTQHNIINIGNDTLKYVYVTA